MVVVRQKATRAPKLAGLEELVEHRVTRLSITLSYQSERERQMEESVYIIDHDYSAQPQVSFRYV